MNIVTFTAQAIANMRHAIFTIVIAFLLAVSPVNAARDTDSYDGNIFPIYAANGSLVPPTTTLAEALRNQRTSVIVFYLDDSAYSKAFAPVVSGIKLVWGANIDLIPLTTDELQGQSTVDASDPSFYWHGNIPQIVVIDGKGNVLLDEDGLVSIEKVNKAISSALGVEAPPFNISIKTFNEYNSEPSKEGYAEPRQVKPNKISLP